MRPVTSFREAVATRSALARLYVSAYVKGLWSRAAFDGVEAYCMFLGYPRSGHSVIGSILDAHPNAIVAHEMDALRFIDRGYSRRQLYALLVEHSRRFTAAGRKWTEFTYAVPNQWHGRYTTLRVIGDKKGGRSTIRFRGDIDLLRRLRETVGVPLRMIHVLRDPFDNISTMYRRAKEKDLQASIDYYFSFSETVARLKGLLRSDEIFDLHLEDFIEDPERAIRDLCRFLSLDCPEDYVKDCRSIVYASPNQSRKSVDWTPDAIAQVEARMARYPFLARYAGGARAGAGR